MNIQKKIPVVVLGATGMVGQRFVLLLADHPWFELVGVAASPQSAGKKYSDAVSGRWNFSTPVPNKAANLTVMSVEADRDELCKIARMAFSAVDLEKSAVQRLEESYAAAGLVVVSNTSAHRWTEDVPVMMPEVNSDHINLIPVQRKKRGWNTGCMVVKPNCSIQAYVPVLAALEEFSPRRVIVTTVQAVSGAGKTLASWPEMSDNIIPFIKGEEEKSEREPLKVLGKFSGDKIESKDSITISATCLRAPVSDGHMVSASVEFDRKPTRDQFLEALANFGAEFAKLELPSAPKQLIHYLQAEDRPQTRLDRDLEHGMAISVGRLRDDAVLGWSFVALSHNTLRGAAGGAVLTAELLVKEGIVK